MPRQTTLPTTAFFTRQARLAAALMLGLAAAACGGGDEPAAPVAEAQGWVTVQGCVVDRHYIPATGTPVRALGLDGRLLGQAQSDREGRFTLRLPDQGTVQLQVDRAGGETLPMRVQAAAPTWSMCLRDEQA